MHFNCVLSHILNEAISMINFIKDSYDFRFEYYVAKLDNTQWARAAGWYFDLQEATNKIGYYNGKFTVKIYIRDGQ